MTTPQEILDNRDAYFEFDDMPELYFITIGIAIELMEAYADQFRQPTPSREDAEDHLESITIKTM